MRERSSRKEAKRGEDTEFEAGSMLWAFSTEPNTGLELMDREIHDPSQSHSRNPLNHPGVPLIIHQSLSFVSDSFLLYSTEKAD